MLRRANLNGQDAVMVREALGPAMLQSQYRDSIGGLHARRQLR